MSVITDIPTVDPIHFWGKCIEANPQLKPVINAVSSGNLLGSAASGKLRIVVDQLSGLAVTPSGVTGAVEMRGSSLPTLPDNGTFEIGFAPVSCTLTIRDHSGFVIHIWHGVGTDTGLEGTFTGDWVKLAS